MGWGTDLVPQLLYFTLTLGGWVRQSTVVLTHVYLLGRELFLPFGRQTGREDVMPVPARGGRVETRGLDTGYQ